MEIVPLPKRIYDKAKELGITRIELEFEGGSDEGYLGVYTEPSSQDEFTLHLEKWAWDAYDYNGAGDGNDYGDTIEYNLNSMKASHSGWYTETRRVDGSSSEIKLEVDN
jgi:hypothetical protein